MRRRRRCNCYVYAAGSRFTIKSFRWAAKTPGSHAAVVHFGRVHFAAGLVGAGGFAHANALAAASTPQYAYA
jgi:hypothetical protein